MSSFLMNLIAIILYLLGSLFLLRTIVRKKDLQKKTLISIAASAIIFHLIGIYQMLVLPEGINLGIFNMASAFMLAINLLTLGSSIQKPLHNLFVFLFPLSILSILLSIFSSTTEPHIIGVGKGIAGHIIFSVLSYCILAMATFQALLWSWQNHQIKQHKATGTVRLLPPLQTMEQLLFEMLWFGVILLALGIAMGFVYLDDIFSQQLVHKTVLSLFALLVFSALLVGRKTLGWRGKTAVKWVLSGFSLLMLAYFGSKFVLEVLLA
jgi:ABC-type uncharacterized transport system permease subunit